MKKTALVKAFAPKLEETIGFLLWDTTRAYNRALATVIGQYGMRSGLFPFLRILYESGGLSFRELSDAAHTRTPTTLEAIREMQRRGLARRKRDVEDARKAKIFLTAKGRRIHEALLPVSATINRDGLEGLSKGEQNELKRLLRVLRANMNRAVERGAHGTNRC